MTTAENTILLVDDDDVLRTALAASLRRRGFKVITASSGEAARQVAATVTPQYAVIDFNLGQGISGLELARDALAIRPDLRIVLVTGFATIETAVESIRLGIRDLLTKPVDCARILQALDLAPDNTARRGPTMKAKKLKSMEIADIQKVMALTGDNISETARRLGMHRRSLQRKLANYG